MPPPGQTRKIIQLLVARSALIALTEDSEVWILHGFDALNSGTDAAPVQWRMLSKTLPAGDVPGPLPVTTW